MKTFKVKNYKGNLVESLKRFSDSHKGMKIVEACEDGDDLKIKAEESEKQQIEEAAGKKMFAVKMIHGDGEVLRGIFTLRQKAQEAADILNDEYQEDDDPEIVIDEITINELWDTSQYIGCLPEYDL